MRQTTTWTRLTQAAALCTTLLSFASCEEKTLNTHEQLYGVPLTLRADWQGHTPTADALSVEVLSLTPGIACGETHTLAAGGTLDLFVPEARYRLTATHGADNVAFDPQSATFRLSPDAAGLLPQPGELSACRLEAELTARQATPLALPLKRLTRTLTLRLRPGAEHAAEVTGMEVRIGGMASAIHIDGYNRGAGTPGTVSIPMSLSEDGTEEGVVYTGSFRTLGTAGEEQRMDVTVHLANGQRFTTGTDITRQLRELNLSREDTFTASFTLDTAGRPGNGFGFSILPWEDGGGDDDGDAGMEIPENE